DLVRGACRPCPAQEARLPLDQEDHRAVEPEPGAGRDPREDVVTGGLELERGDDQMRDPVEERDRRPQRFDLSLEGPQPVCLGTPAHDAVRYSAKERRWQG